MFRKQGSLFSLDFYPRIRIQWFVCLFACVIVSILWLHVTSFDSFPECKTVAVNGVNYQCVFPFKYKYEKIFLMFLNSKHLNIYWFLADKLSTLALLMTLKMVWLGAPMKLQPTVMLFEENGQIVKPDVLEPEAVRKISSFKSNN